MEDAQLTSLLQAIAISSGLSTTSNITEEARYSAYCALEQFKSFPGRIPVALSLLQTERHTLLSNSTAGSGIDVTTPTKLFILSVIQSFLRTDGYAKLNDAERIALRNSVVAAARHLLVAEVNDGRVLAMKIASVLADIVVREFPQRWTAFVTEVFASTGGLWSEHGDSLGVKVVLETLKLVTEDCTDSDFNAKISTTRRNDILIGLNEVHSQFLPLLFQSLSTQYANVRQTKSELNIMHAYLASSGRNLSSMSLQERAVYQTQVTKRDKNAKLVVDCLSTLEKFCQSMPMEWMLSNTGETNFLAALLHLLRENEAQIQVWSVACLYQLTQRKLEFEPWMRLISALPGAVSEANEEATRSNSDKMRGDANTQLLVEQLPFHRELSKMLACLISSHLAHITTDKEMMTKDHHSSGAKKQALASYLHLLAEMLSHPSARICAEQINTWIALLRDPQISKAQTQFLGPYMERVLSAYMFHTVKLRWEDVEKQTHPLTALLEASWDDKEEYDACVGDLRSKTSQLFKFGSSIEPKLSANMIHQKVTFLLTKYGKEEPQNCLRRKDSIELRQLDEANIQFEGIQQPLDCILQGLPAWAMDDSKKGNHSFMEGWRVEIRSSVRLLLSEVAGMIVSWNPADTWLKFRRAALLEALKRYWKYDPTTLSLGVDALLGYLCAEEPTLPCSLRVEGGRARSGDVIGLRKKSGVSLVNVSKAVPHLLVPWLEQLSDRVKSLLSSESLLQPNRMHLYEFLSCVVTAVEDPVSRSNFISAVLSNALEIIESKATQEAMASIEGLMSFMGILHVGTDPSSATDLVYVERFTANFEQLFSAFNQLLSVGKRCHEAAKKRINEGISVREGSGGVCLLTDGVREQQNFPDEGAVSINELAINDPFVPLWPRILPSLLQVLDVTLRLWHPQYQAVLLQNPMQRFVYAVSDDEAYLAMKQDSTTGGVFGKGGTAGSVVSGWDRRDSNLVPRWSGWFNELRTTCFQMLGLLAAQRVLYAPELANEYPQFVTTVANSSHLQAMEHRHFTQYLKQFVEYLMLSCPVTLYHTHLSHILGPIFEHIQSRLQGSWDPVLGTSSLPTESTKALTSSTASSAVSLARSGGDMWYASYYARGGLFVGDLDAVTAESLVEKVRVELSRSFSDMLQAALALKGDWALVLANHAKEDQALRRGDPDLLSFGPKSRLNESEGPVNADGTPRGENDLILDARKSLRIQSLCHFLLLEDERIAGFLVLSVIQCLEYPDAYTCRRCTRICHRILETVSWENRYTQILGNRMFTSAVKAIVTEPKWMVGIEWDMINVIRDIYCRLVLGQALLAGGQGPGMQQSRDSVDPRRFEQSKFVDMALQGGGILCIPSDLPKQVLLGLPGITAGDVSKLNSAMMEKRSAKDQKDVLRDLLRVASENLKQLEVKDNEGTGLFSRALTEESLLNQNVRKAAVPDLPEKLVTHTMVMKKEAEGNVENIPAAPSLGNLFNMR